MCGRIVLILARPPRLWIIFSFGPDGFLGSVSEQKVITSFAPSSKLFNPADEVYLANKEIVNVGATKPYTFWEDNQILI